MEITQTGHLNFSTNSTIKYTCIKIRFLGIVSTKVSKVSEEVYVLNQQVVLLGNPNNSEESILPEGKHSWPFEFRVPLHHIPSSGKYRHGTVKYTLSASITSKSFLGNMQEIKANTVIHLKDLINCLIQPYSDPVIANGSSNTKPDTDKDKNLASAQVNISRSAFLKGQLLHLTINLSHPKGIQRDPGCWIQLLRKETYQAGKEIKEYSHVVATSTYGVNIDSSTKKGNILAELSIPDSAIPTMVTTKIVSIRYFILILFDMRSKTGFMEGKARRNVSKKLRTKLLNAPGGFEIEIPITIGTVSDLHHQHRSSPFIPDALRSDLAVTNTINPIASITSATSKLSISAASNSASPVLVASSTSSSSPRSGSSSLTSTHDTRAGYNTLPAVYGRHASEPDYRPTTSNVNDYANRSRTLPGQQSSPSYQKALPSLPSIFTTTSAIPTAPMFADLTTSPGHISSPSANSYPFQQQPHFGPTPSMPSTYYPPPSSSSSSSYAYAPQSASQSATNPADSTLTHGQNGYPREKFTSPVHRHVNIQPPLSFQLPAPTAPQAVDVGLGPSSPGLSNRNPHRMSNQSFSSGPNRNSGEGYSQYQSRTASGPRNPQHLPPPNANNSDLVPPYTQSAQQSSERLYTSDYNKR
ncbi:hypothetical protein BGZ49_002224 [Haplosporangium sp. Z 27]|nr:hypothetical protein BGZ49_002224 [Haplosporangium sp. Z 27]